MKVMKKSYNNPSTSVVSFVSPMVCAVGSVHGETPLQFGGAVTDTSDPTYKPM